jgi:uncharacterized protein
MMIKQPHSLFQRIFKHPISIIVIGTLTLLIAIVLFKELISKPILSSLFSAEFLVKTITAIISTFVMILAYYLHLKYFEKKSFSEFSTNKMHKEFPIGLLIGFGSMGMVVFILYILGYYNIIAIKSFNEFLPTMAFIFGAAVLEEIIFRGLFFRLLEHWKGPIIALLISSLIFQIPHFMNSHTGILPGILGVLFGVVTGLMYAYTRRLWLPIAFHFGWNIVQPIFGTNLSGGIEFTKLIEAKLNGPELLIGSEFGLEVSLFSFVMLLIIGLYYYSKLRNRSYFKIN